MLRVHERPSKSYEHPTGRGGQVAWGGEILYSMPRENQSARPGLYGKQLAHAARAAALLSSLISSSVYIPSSINFFFVLWNTLL